MPRANVLPDGVRVTQLRTEAALTQVDLAQQTGYGLRTIGKIESGAPTRASTLAAVAEVLARRLGRPLGLADLVTKNQGQPGELLAVIDLRGRGGVEVRADVAGLAVLVLFPEEQTPRSVFGEVRSPSSAPKIPPSEGPVLVAGGSAAFWRVPAPDGAVYKVGWEE
jgi:transcriptional regulator with XRE-family HTH domain